MECCSNFVQVFPEKGVQHMTSSEESWPSTSVAMPLSLLSHPFPSVEVPISETVGSSCPAMLCSPDSAPATVFLNGVLPLSSVCANTNDTSTDHVAGIECLSAEKKQDDKAQCKVVGEESSCPSIVTTVDAQSPSSMKAPDGLHSGEAADCVDDMLDVLSYSYEELAAPIEDVGVAGDSSWDYNQACSSFIESPAAQLCVPDDNIAELDWMPDYGHGDIFSSHNLVKGKVLHSRYDRRHSMPWPQASSDQHCQSISDQSFTQLQNSKGIEGEVAFPIRARSKRSRGMSRAWSSSNLLSSMENEDEGTRKRMGRSPSFPARVPALSPDCSPSVSEDGHGVVPDYYATDSDPSGWENSEREDDSFSRPAFNMHIRHVNESNIMRRCSHCETTKTPQWRAGPNGPKTLCNACGVRFKSGRLLPEYRPAGSPGYVGNRHSNSHRKIMEMRRKKEQDYIHQGHNFAVPAGSPAQF